MDEFEITSHEDEPLRNVASFEGVEAVPTGKIFVYSGPNTIRGNPLHTTYVRVDATCVRKAVLDMNGWEDVGEDISIFEFKRDYEHKQDRQLEK